MKNQRSKDKKALSPIVTTVLLVLLAIVLATIVLLWARGFIKEPVSKFSPSLGEDRPIAEVCGESGVQASISGNQIQVTNIQSVPIYKLGIRITGQGESTLNYAEVNLTAGGSVLVNPGADITAGTPKVEVIPVLLGVGEKGDYKEYNCLNNAYLIQ